MHEKNYSKFVRRLFKSKYYTVLIRNDSSKEFGYEVVVHAKALNEVHHYKCRTLENALLCTLDFVSDSWKFQYDKDSIYI